MNWKIFLIALCLLPFAGCAARTTLYGNAGQKVFVTSADARGLAVTGGGSTLTAESLDHSTPTRASREGIATIATAIGSAAGAIGAAGFLTR